MALGTPEQQERFLPPILRAEEFWCQGSASKLHWSRWHQRLGELAMDLYGAESQVASTPAIDDARYDFLFSRSHPIYAGSSEIQRNIIGERVLGLPKE